MVEYDSQTLDTVFHALSDATRRGLLQQLQRGEQSVGQLAQPFDMSLAAVSKHIKVLEDAGLVRRKVQGRTHLCGLSHTPLIAVDQWISMYRSYWTEQLDALEKLLRDDDESRIEKIPDKKMPDKL